MKTHITDTTLIDLLLVCKELPADEIEQIKAFSGNENFDPEDSAAQIYTSDRIKWTCRIKETGEPLVVAGYFQVGVGVWRSYMLARELAWTKYGAEVTKHVNSVIESMAKQPNIRLETICLASRKKARAWYERIGLEYESTLRSYGANGEDAVMYVKTEQRIVQPKLIH